MKSRDIYVICGTSIIVAMVLKGYGQQAAVLAVFGLVLWSVVL